MIINNMTKFRLTAIWLCLLMPLISQAQLAGHNTRGDYALLSGTQAPPGFYIVPMFYDYSADKVRDRNGDEFAPLGGGGDINARAGILGLSWVTEKKVLGGNYGFSIWPAVTNNALGFPALETGIGASTGLADLYVQPISLGWNRNRADYVAGVGIYAPTGDFDIDSNTNRGLGMWSLELFGGTTLYLDEAKSWHLSALAFFETHGKKEDTNIRVGNILTVEGGLGKSYMEGAMSVGLAYYAQWKLTDDDLDTDVSLPSEPLLSKHRVYGFGPEVSLPLASKQKLYGFLNLRYFWETGARSTLEGNTFLATFSFPVPSIPLQ